MQRQRENADVEQKMAGKRERERDDMENHPAQTASRKSHLPLQKTFFFLVVLFNMLRGNWDD
jgi:hypothetical protein